MKILFKKTHPDAITPKFAKPGDAGMDMCALEDFAIAPGQTVIVDTGIALEIPAGFFGSARERSGLAAKGIRLGGGVIDSGYRGPVKAILTNLNLLNTFHGKRGDRVFQVIIQPCLCGPAAELCQAADLSETERGADGFGSTGK